MVKLECGEAHVSHVFVEDFGTVFPPVLDLLIGTQRCQPV